MADGLWRCVNPDHGDLDFRSPKGVCPECGAGDTERSRLRFILRRKVVHFDPPARPGEGRSVKACDGKPWGEGTMATGVPAAVTCPACRESAEFRKASESGEDEPGYAVPEAARKAEPAKAKPAG